MAQTYSVIKSFVDKGRNDLKCGIFSIAFGDGDGNGGTTDDRYKTGGIALPAASVNPSLSALYSVIPIGGSLGYHFEFDYANKKLLCYVSDLSEATDGPMVQLANDSAALGTANIVLYCQYEGI